MKIILLLLSYYFLLASNVSTTLSRPQNNNFDGYVRSIHKKCSYGDIVYLELFIINKSNQNIKLLTLPQLIGYNTIIRDSKGIKVRFTGPRITMNQKYMDIQSGDSLKFIFNLDYFGEKKNKNPHFYLLETDVYQIYINIPYQFSSKNTVDTLHLTASITIDKLSEKDAAILKDYFTNYLDSYKRGHQKLDYIIKLVDNNTDSKIFGRILRSAISNAYISDDTEDAKYLLHFLRIALEKFPDEPFTEERIHLFFNDTRIKKVDNLQFLKSIMLRYPNSRSSSKILYLFSTKKTQ